MQLAASDEKKGTHYGLQRLVLQPPLKVMPGTAQGVVHHCPKFTQPVRVVVSFLQQRRHLLYELLLAQRLDSHMYGTWGACFPRRRSEERRVGKGCRVRW